MQGITKVDHKFYGNGSLSKPFQSLEHLIFSEMLEWVEWYILGAGEFPRLQELCVVKCSKLVGGLPKTIPSLVRLEIRECSKLMAPLPKACDAGASTCKLLVLKGCDGVELEWHGISSLVKLEISNMPSLKELTPDLCILTNLKDLKIKECPNLLSFPDTGLPPMVTHLSIIDCEAIQSLPMGMIPLKNCLNHLKQLFVVSCPNLVFPIVEEMENCYTSLETLSLECCDALKSMPLGFFPKLRSLEIQNCTNFESLSVLNRNRLELQNLTSLESLLLNGLSNNMVSFPQGGLPLPNLTNFSIYGCYKLKSLPEGMHTLLPSLKSLDLYNCPEIESFPEGGLPSNLSSLEIWNCSKLTACRREWNLQRLPSLRHFTLTGEYDGLSFPEDGMEFFPKDRVESFPEEGLLPSTLITLHIGYLSNLKSLNKKGLQLLGSLKKLKIKKCPQLQFLPEEGLPPSLFMLNIFDCPMLKLRCLKEEGHDWHKIACVPFVFIDSEVIFEQVTLESQNHHHNHTVSIFIAAMSLFLTMGFVRCKHLISTLAYIDIARKYGLHPVSLAIAFVLKHPLVASTIFGATKLWQLQQVLDARKMELNPEIIVDIDKVPKEY
ncbi:putative disease resistance protein [Camellia lanceoleosa]|uniref:Disease resistance protein n=1 Tax=Camellia lanceoleosa TaxID=1840588 RepID=A0ACC0IMP9_9ERIC|nr:putative disease resistance protein [Camellia lanceoleosa]